MSDEFFQFEKYPKQAGVTLTAVANPVSGYSILMDGYSKVAS